MTPTVTVSKSYLHQVPALQRLSDDGRDRRTHPSEDHQVLGTVANGVEERSQTLSVVTLEGGAARKRRGQKEWRREVIDREGMGGRRERNGGRGKRGIQS